ncbi:hypothetical protein NLJ89_g5594 [Agrocybe chaxingu]|uniref:G domain-containing protein n=1 Tax=Agrocybe chaxingu TaxID=84603 RepID=A0A9W8MUV3_9AGAR|nr:hypothetical protein NLJ89_g5594 [Agrocybe chaxingu]
MAPMRNSSNYEDPDLTANGRQEDIVIAVMGSTGTGKSSFIRLLTGNTDVKVGDSLESETSDIQIIRFCDGPSGRNITIVDTPGFDDSRAGVTDTDILRTITDFLLKEYDENRKLNGLVYLQRISDPRFGGQSSRNLRMFRNLCEEEGIKREGQLKTRFFKDLVDGGACFMQHDRTIESAREVLGHILPLPPAVAQIQTEIREEGKTLEDTSAGSVHREEVDRIIANHKKEVADLKAEMDSLKESNTAARRELEQERAKLQADLARWENERSELQKGLGEEKKSREKLEVEAAKIQAQLNQQMKGRESTDERRRREEAVREAVERALREERMKPYSKKAMQLAEDIPLVPNFIAKPYLGALGVGLDISKRMFGR